MKKELSRIPFGREPKQFMLSTNCPSCETNLGHDHEYGCPIEACPECGGMLLKCSCGVLSFRDEYRTTKAISGIMDLDWARRLLEKSPFLENGLEENGAFMWLMENQPIELQQELDALNEKSFRDLETYGLGIEPELEMENLFLGWDKHTGLEQIN